MRRPWRFLPIQMRKVSTNTWAPRVSARFDRKLKDKRESCRACRLLPNQFLKTGQWPDHEGGKTYKPNVGHETTNHLAGRRHQLRHVHRLHGRARRGRTL